MITKEKIIFESLNLFAIHGYEAVSMRDIGGAVGIRESSIYKHYAGKKAIMDAIVDKAVEELNGMLSELNIPHAAQKSDISQYADMEFEKIADLCVSMLLAQRENDFIRKFRQLLTIEQYRNEGLKNILVEMFMERQLQYVEKVFEQLLKNGILKGHSAKTMALQFYSPFFMLQYKYKDDKERLKQELKDHVVDFIKEHANMPA